MQQVYHDNLFIAFFATSWYSSAMADMDDIYNKKDTSFVHTKETNEKLV